MSFELSQLIIIPLLALLVCTALTVARMRDLWAAVMLTGIYSFLGAGWMLDLDAPDVAFTEAAVGAGISTFLMLGTLALTSRTAKRQDRFPWLPLIVVVFTGGTLVYGTLDMPHFGDPNAPIHNYPKPGYIDIALGQREGRIHDPRHALRMAQNGGRQAENPRPVEEVEESPRDPHATETRGTDAHGTDAHGADAHGTDAHGTDAHGTDAHGTDAHGTDAHGETGHEPVPNIVTVVLASYRGFDTLGETSVIFTAGIAVMLLLKGNRREDVQL